MIQTIQKDNLYAQSSSVKNRWEKSATGRNITIEIEDEGVRQLCILHKIVEEPSNGIALLEMKKLEVVNSLGQWSEVGSVNHYISSKNYVDSNGDAVPEEEAFDEDGNLKEGYNNDYDYFDVKFNRTHGVLRENGIRDFLEKVFVTIPNSI